jgi:hypothetical protein
MPFVSRDEILRACTQKKKHTSYASLKDYLGPKKAKWLPEWYEEPPTISVSYNRLVTSAKLRSEGYFHSDNPLGFYLLYVATCVRQAGDARLAIRLAECFGSHHESDLLKPLVELIFRAATNLFRQAREEAELQSLITGPQEKADLLKRPNKFDDEHSSSDEEEKHNWGYHNLEEEPSNDFFREDSLEGTLEELSMSLPNNSNAPDPRRVKKAAKRKTIWVKQLSGHKWEAFFKTQSLFEKCRDRMEKWLKSTQHKSNHHKQS